MTRAGRTPKSRTWDKRIKRGEACMELEPKNGGAGMVPSTKCWRERSSHTKTGTHLSSDREIRGDQADLGPTWTHVKTQGKE